MIKKKSDLIIWILVCLAMVVVVVAIYMFIRVLDIETFESSFVVGDRPGFDINPTALTFGQLVESNGASRSIFVKNDYKRPVKIEIRSKGEIAEYLSVSENYFVLGPGEEREIAFNIYAPEGLEKRYYLGEVSVKTLRLFFYE